MMMMKICMSVAWMPDDVMYENHVWKLIANMKLEFMAVVCERVFYENENLMMMDDKWWDLCLCDDDNDDIWCIIVNVSVSVNDGKQKQIKSNV